MRMTPEQQAIYDDMTPEKQAYYDVIFAEADRIEALPIEEKVDLLMSRVSELISAVQHHQREFEGLTEIMGMLVQINQTPAPMPPCTEPRHMPGQYL